MLVCWFIWLRRPQLQLKQDSIILFLQHASLQATQNIQQMSYLIDNHLFVLICYLWMVKVAIERNCG